MAWCTMPWTAAEELTQEWIAQYEQEAFEDAAQTFHAATKKRWRSATARWYLGRSLSEVQRFDRAKIALEKAKKLWYADHAIHNQLGRIALVTWSLDVAESLFLKAIEEQSEKAEYYTNLGLVYYYTQDFENAELFFLKAIERDGQHFKALLNMWVLLADKWEFRRALKYLDAAGEVDPNNPGVIYNKATVLSDISYSLKQTSWTWFALYAYEALRLFDIVIEQDPENPSPYIFKAITNYDIDNYEKALDWVNQALTIDAWNLDALFYKGKIHTELKEYDEAEETFEQILSIDPSNEQVAQELSDLARRQQ